MTMNGMKAVMSEGSNFGGWIFAPPIDDFECSLGSASEDDEPPPKATMKMPRYGLYRAFGAGRARMRAPLDPENVLVARPTRGPPTGPIQPDSGRRHKLAAGTDTYCTNTYTSAIVSFGKIMNIRRVHETR